MAAQRKSLWVRETKSYDSITEDERRAMVFRARKDNLRGPAMDEILELYRDYLYGQAGYWHRRFPGISVGEFLSAAHGGVNYAVERFDPGRESAFFVYLQIVVQTHIKRLLRKKKEERERYKGFSLDEVDDEGELLRQLTSSAPNPLEKCIEDEKRAALDELGRFLRRTKIITSQERKVLRLRFFGKNGDGPGEVRSAIGHDINLTAERVRQIENDALDKLRQALPRLRRFL